MTLIFQYFRVKKKFISLDMAMIRSIRTNSENPDFIELVRQLDADLAERDGAEHSFYAQFNKIAKIKHVVVAYEDNEPVSCGAIKEFEPGSMEVKRMYTLPKMRGKGIAAMVLSELEKWAAELGCSKCVLETGKRQPEAIALYTKRGYKIIPNYGQYQSKDNSVCFEKMI
jgi:putative acetyltransferase